LRRVFLVRCTQPKTAWTPVVIVAGRAVEDVPQIDDAAVLQKPVDADAVIEAVHSAIQRPRRSLM
jgi:hypothetical protein